jgi:hypothetical protein
MFHWFNEKAERLNAEADKIRAEAAKKRVEADRIGAEADKIWADVAEAEHQLELDKRKAYAEIVREAQQINDPQAREKLISDARDSLLRSSEPRRHAEQETGSRKLRPCLH